MQLLVTKCVHEPIWISKVKVIHWPWSKGHSFFNISNFFSSETTGPIETKFHVAPPWDGGTKVCSNGSGHMTKMAATLIYGKNLKKKIFLSGNKKPMTLKVSMQHRLLEYFQMCSNDDPGWPWPILRQIWSLMLLYWEKGFPVTILG